MGPSRAKPESDVVLCVRDLTTVFETQRGTVTAVNKVSFDLRRGETVGIVGESGSGKSMTALSLIGLVPAPGRVVSGQVLLNGIDLLKLKETEMRRVRGSGVSLILQNPMTTLNPVFTIGNQMVETIRTHRSTPRPERNLLAKQLLEKVRIPAAADRLKSYQHQLSGGMRQRVAGALALACEPTVLIADEPTTALDATTQLQYLDMMRQLQREAQLGVIFITHDFGIVAGMCDYVAVMYAGRVVEYGHVLEIFNRPTHPYTRALLDSVPKPDAEVERLASIPGQPPALHDLPSGCPFAPRCSEVREVCWTTSPPTVAVSDNHQADCWAASP